MAAFVGKLVAKKLVSGKGSNNQRDEDPYHEKVAAKKYGVKYTAKREKALHPGLTSKEAEILTKAKRRAYRLDMALRIPCIGRFGWSSVIGLIPAVGDVIDLLLGLMLIRTCDSVEPKLPSTVKFAMYRNLALDFALGLVPLLGDFADAVYKSNTKNVVLLEHELVKRAEKRQKDAGRVTNQAAGANSAQDHEVFENEHEMRASSGPPPRYTSTKNPRRPEQAYDPERTEVRAGYFSAGNEVDLEAGEGIPPQQPLNQQSSRPHRNDGRAGRR